MSQDVRFLTHNIGIGFGDYEAMVCADEKNKKKLQEEYNAVPDGEEETFKSQRMKKIEEDVATRLASAADILCLQEVKDQNRPLCKKLEELGFTLYRLDRSETSWETVVAVRKSIAREVKNISIKSRSHPDENLCGYGQQIAGVVVRLDNGARLAFSSLHSWGFAIYRQDADKKPEFPQDIVSKRYALTYMKEAVDNVKKHKTDFSAIMGDLNNNEENYTPPFQYLKESGYAIHGPNEETNVNRFDENYKFRKIDYIFTSQQTLLKKIVACVRSIFCPSIHVTVQEKAKVLPGFDFTAETNCSDHKPFAMTIHTKATASKLHSLLHLFIPRRFAHAG